MYIGGENAQLSHFSFGQAQGDLTLEKVNDEALQVTLPTGIWIGSTLHDTVYVSIKVFYTSTKSRRGYTFIAACL